MGDTNLTAAEAGDAFWDSLKKSQIGMLGLDQPGYHAQPMTAFREEETGTIWFFTRDDTDLARDAALPGGQSAMFHYMSKDQHVWACVHGQLAQVHDRERIEDVIAKVVAEAKKQGLSPAIAEPVWRTLIDRCIAYEFESYDALSAPLPASS